MNEIQVTWKTVLYIFSVIPIIGMGISWLMKLFKPYKNLKSIVNDNTIELENLRTSIDELRKSNQISFEIVLSILDYEINESDENKARIKELRKEAEEYLIRK